MRVRKEHGQLIAEPAADRDDRISLEGIYGSVPGIRRPPCEENPRDWYLGPANA